MRVVSALLAALGAVSPAEGAEPPMPGEIVKLVEAGRTCSQDVHLGMACSFTVDSLQFTIFGVGEIEPSVGFMHSDMHERFYATAYVGCVGIGTGMVYLRSSPPQQVYVSTKTGNVFFTRKQCQSAN
jgi:hypothetical protein